jgi:hypothetical protein
MGRDPGRDREAAVGDSFLGWSQGPTRDFFLRQLRDTKLSLMAEEEFTAGRMSGR